MANFLHFNGERFNAASIWLCRSHVVVTICLCHSRIRRCCENCPGFGLPTLAGYHVIFRVLPFASPTPTRTSYNVESQYRQVGARFEARWFGRGSGVNPVPAGNLDKWHGLCEALKVKKVGLTIGLRLPGEKHPAPPSLVNSAPSYSKREMSATIQLIVSPRKGRQPKISERCLYRQLSAFFIWRDK